MPRIIYLSQFFFFFNSANTIFGQMFGHQRAEIDAWNRKMNRGQDNNPVGVFAKYEMN